MYPLNMTNPVAGGYAVASNEDEHKALTDAGYLPAYVSTDDPPKDAEPVKRSPGRPRKVQE